MGLKDDFVEALRSVKRDFTRDQEKENTTQAQQSPANFQAGWSDRSGKELPQPERQASAQPQTSPFESPLPAPELEPETGLGGGFSSAFESDILRDLELEPPPEEPDAFDDYNQADAVGDLDDILDDSFPYHRFKSDAPLEETASYYGSGKENHGNTRAFIDFGDNGGVYDDEKTVISKNTVIRGALQTEDSVRLLGQILGDIDCKSNIVVAGKVRGNTSAVNAYIFDAQIDGDIRCDDIITISNDAWILGNIRAQQAEVDGKIKGNMEIRHMLSIGSTSSILGDISTDELEIKRGAFINGQIMMYSPSRDVLDQFDRFDEK